VLALVVEAPPQPPDMPGGSQAVAAAERLRSASVSAEAARAATMFLDGLDPAAIALRALPSVAVWELRQVKSSQGGKYQSALGEVLGLIREGLQPAQDGRLHEVVVAALRRNSS
jgi:hypothetical protein